MKFFDEFKEFIARGNVMDMAVGVVVGGAFKSIVDSLVTDIITPGLALITKLFKSSADAVAGDGTADKMLDMKNWIIPGTEINIGSFIQSIISFLILAFVIFCVVKGVNTMRSKLERKKEEEVHVVEDKPADIQLLEEIRDAIVNK